MKRIALSIAALLATASIAPAVDAMPTNRPVDDPLDRPVNSPTNRPVDQPMSRPIGDQDQTGYEMDPFDLSYYAYQGNLESEGIPGYLSLLSSIRNGQIQAADLIEAAVESGDLSSSALEDNQFEREVQNILDSLPDRQQ